VDPDDVETDRWGWVAWVLVVACVVPPLLLAEAARRVLGGSYDLEYFGGYSGGYLSDGTLESAATRDELTSRLDVSVGDRFTVLWEQLSLPAPLLGPALAGVLTAAVVLLGRPAVMVPGRWAARIAAGGLGLAGLEAVAVTLGVLESLSGPDSFGEGSLQVFWGSRPPTDLVEFAAAAALLLPAILVPAVAGFVVLRGGVRRAETPVVGEPVVEESVAQAESTEEAADVETVEEELPEPPTVPALTEAQRELYRRR